MLNFINSGGGHPLCTLHQAKELYSWVTRRGVNERLRYTPAAQAELSVLAYSMTTKDIGSGGRKFIL